MKFKNFHAYDIKEDGTVININSGKHLKRETTKNGYQRITLSANGKTHRYLIHRLVALCYIPNPVGYPCVNHINGDKTDNRVDNLEWCDYSQNEKHSYEVLGKKAISGVDHYNYKVDPRTLNKILTSPLSARKLSEEIGISFSHIAKIRRLHKRATTIHKE